MNKLKALAVNYSARQSLYNFILITVVVLFLYGPTIPLPYFWDDFPQFNFALAKTYWQHWTDVEGLPYYRPLVTTVYRALFTLLPFGATALPHTLVLLVHIGSSLLTGKLAGLFWLRHTDPEQDGFYLIEPIAALLFAIYPFAALPVVHFAAAFHPVVTFLALLGTVCLINYALTGSHWLLAAAIFLAFVSPYAHESGIVVGGLMVAALLLYDHSLLLRQKWLVLVIPMASLLFLAAWLVVPKSQDPNATLLVYEGVTITLAKLSFFAQAVFYPTMPAATWLIDQRGWWDLTAIWLVGGVTLLFLVWVLRSSGQWRLLVLGFGWTAVIMLPSIVALHYDYMSISPRLLYFAGPGTAVMWAGVWVGVGRKVGGRGIRPFLLFLLAIITVAAPCIYITRQVRLHQLALEPITQYAEMAPQYPHDRHLIINAPNWLAYQRRWYPIGNDGVAVLAPYMNTKQLIYTNSGVNLDVEVVTFVELRPQLETHYLATANEAPDQLWHPGIMGERVTQFDHVWFTNYTDDQAAVEYAGYVRPAQTTPPQNYLGNFKDDVYLLEADFITEADTLILSLDWFYTGTSPNATIFRNVLTCSGEIAGNGTGPALRGTLPFDFLAAPGTIHDVRTIQLEIVDPTDCYTVEVGLFYNDGSRVPIQAPDNSFYANDLIPVRSAKQ